MGDIAIFYVAFLIALAIRNGLFSISKNFMLDVAGFSSIFILWVVIFYIADLYSIEQFISEERLAERVTKTMFYSGAISVLIFYIVPYFIITPKTILILTVFIAGLFIWGWRKYLFLSSERNGIRVFFAGDTGVMKKFSEHLVRRPQLGYCPVDEVARADIIVASTENGSGIDALYSLVQKGYTVINFDRFYETVTGKIPIYLVTKHWFLDNLVEINKRTFEIIKRGADIVLAIIAAVPTLLLFAPVAILIKLTSRGPILFRQTRVGKDGKTFTISKFRTMRDGADTIKDGWSKPTDDRVTFIGKILRMTRIDELPQIWNVFRGEMSFVGPRPERPEFVRELVTSVPHYSMRHIIKPGLAGWGQLYMSDASAEDAHKKLQYDLYYIKNRSLTLDVQIILKTILILLSRTGR